MYQVEPIIYRREQKGIFDFVSGVDSHTLTHLLYEAGKEEGTPKMSIGVLGYRHIEDTKRCVESVLRYVEDIDYELILIDNGSDDGNETLEYFQCVPTMRKKIIQVDEALGPAFGSVFGTRLMYEYSRGDIFVFLGNDNIITENALQNMIVCLDSSPDIGLVTPMSSNVYMLQDPGLQYSNFEEMHAAAKAFNRSDPRKWQERMELSVVATAVKREALIQSGFYGFWTAEADLCRRVRLAGYKTILLGDTWVCHNHDYNTKTDTQAWLGGTEASQSIAEQLKAMQKVRSGGLDQFGEIMVFEHQLLSLLEKPAAKIPTLLAVNVTAGQPLLDLRNKLREYEIFQSDSTAFTTDAKYYTLLSTVAGRVFCDRIQFLKEDLEDRKFDVVMLGEPINFFPDPEGLLKSLLLLLNPGGQLLFKLKNSCDVKMLQTLLGNPISVEMKKRFTLMLDNIKQMATRYGASSMKILQVVPNYTSESIQLVTNIIANTKAVQNVPQVVQNILTDEYLFQVM